MRQMRKHEADYTRAVGRPLNRTQQVHVVIYHLVDRPLHDPAAVDQMFDLDQRAIHKPGITKLQPNCPAQRTPRHCENSDIEVIAREVE